jgi:hypothetical protein
MGVVSCHGPSQLQRRPGCSAEKYGTVHGSEEKKPLLPRLTIEDVYVGLVLPDVIGTFGMELFFPFVFVFLFFAPLTSQKDH